MKVLRQIYTGVDDIGLLNLAETSYRFEGIAKAVFKERYTNQYFVIDGESEEEQELYWSLFSYFGECGGIKAVKAIEIHGINANHWMARMLQKHTKQLRKLTMDACTFRNTHEFLSQHMDITHLKLRNNNTSHIELPKFRNLKLLELNKVRLITFETIRRAICDNPTMESLHIRCSGSFIFHEAMAVVVECSKHLKELVLIDANLFNEYEDNMMVWQKLVENFNTTFSQIESLGLSVNTYYADLLKRFGLACKKVKHLELKVPIDDRLGSNLIDGISLFENVESFVLEQDNYNDEIEAVIMRLPKLRHFRIKLGKSYTYTFILDWVRKYPMLDRITIVVDYVRYDDPAFLVNVQFFYKFREIVQNRSVCIEFEEDSQIIGFITKNEIIWRNNLKYWIGWDPKYNLTNLHLFDLAKQPLLNVETAIGNAETAKQKTNLFHLILDQLDLGSIYAIAKTNKQGIQRSTFSFSAVIFHLIYKLFTPFTGRQMVGRYMAQHSEQQAPFAISNEFNADVNQHIYGAQLFAKFVTNLNVFNLDWNRTYALQNLIRNSYKSVHKLSICETDDNHPNAWITHEVHFKSFFRLKSA